METSQFLKGSTVFVVRVLLITVIMICTGCVSMFRIDGPYLGKVIDSETKEPLEGVVVHGDWYKVWGTVGGASSEWHDSYETLTDKNGEFRIPGKGLLIFSSIDELTLTIFKAGYEQWTPNPWGGLKRGKWEDGSLTWQGNKPTFRLTRLSMEQRRKKGVVMPNASNNKMKLLIIESNKEMIETGRPKNTLMPVE
jgi:hypothetical protein